MHRRSFAIKSIAACTIPALAAASLPTKSQRERTLHENSSEGSSESATFTPLRFDEKIEHQMNSAAVKWSGRDYHLVTLQHFEFSHVPTKGKLTAKAGGSKITFDNVDFNIGIAVFDNDDVLLGTASSICPVQRIWLGRVLTQKTEIEFDFGVSNQFSSAAKFCTSISAHNVLTPDDWQK